jgi:hypothetical protein
VIGCLACHTRPKSFAGIQTEEKSGIPDIQGLSETYASPRKYAACRVNPLWLTGPSPKGVINNIIAPGRVRGNEMQRSASDMSFRGSDQNSDNLQPLKFEYLPKYQPPIPPASPTAGFFCLQGCRYVPERRDAREGRACREGRFGHPVQRARGMSLQGWSLRTWPGPATRPLIGHCSIPATRPRQLAYYAANRYP